MKRVVLTFALLLAFGVGQAQAAYIGTTPNTNNVIGTTEGIFGADLFLIAGANTSITIEFLGKEAGYTNTFYVTDALLGEQLIYSTASYLNSSNYPSPPGSGFPAGQDATTRLMSPGLMGFRFGSDLGNPGSVTNGSNINPDGAHMNFFLTLGTFAVSPSEFQGDRTIDGVTAFSGNVVILALDDSGAGPDDNHDDMVVRLSITNGSFGVPDGGATLMLLGGALLGIGALRRRFNV